MRVPVKYMLLSSIRSLRERKVGGCSVGEMWWGAMGVCGWSRGCGGRQLGRLCGRGGGLEEDEESAEVDEGDGEGLGEVG